VYTGKDNDSASPTEVVQKLLRQDPDLLNNSAGRVLLTDNYYTSEELMEVLYEDYNILLVGTVKLSKKKSRTETDYPYAKLSGPAKKLVKKGWTRWAQKEVKKNGNTAYIEQATTWMDRKQVGILHNWLVGPPGDFRMLRWDSDKRARVPVEAHEIIPAYVLKMRGVDRIDRSMGDYSASEKGNRFYCRIFWYLIDAIKACCWIVLLGIVKYSPNRAEPWKKYADRGSRGRLQFEIDLGRSLMAHGIGLDWKDIQDKSQRPKYMRQQAFLPCRCKSCFFCVNNLTGPTGPPTASPRKHRRSPSPLPANSKHAELVKDRVQVCECTQNCGECMRKNRKRKPKAGEEKMHMTRLGCPHPLCRDHPVCEDCWADFKHHKR
jgi:hypothetical protein